MAVPRLIVGLGNPGAEHEGDRHNAGFWLVDRWLGARGVALRREAKFFGFVARTTLGRAGAAECWVLKPYTYMNLSGQAVAALARFYRIAPEEIVIAFDELDLPPGTARLKLGGSSTHNGLRDITARLGTAAYWRLRIGIGHPRDIAPGRDVSGYVLGRPSAADREAMIAAIDRAIDILPLIAADQHGRAIQALHTDPKPAAAARPAEPPAERPTGPPTEE
jgi:PTH1 family peptidyl-tRNA hydrolase